ncbi:MAG: hypothetical protein ABIQ40_11415 [Bacteroidia bacterium]
MKIKLLSLALVAVVFSISCKDGNDKSKGDTTMYDETRPIGENHLEDLLDIKDEAELKTKFGKEHITYDTIWGPEGSYFMGSYIDKGTFDEVEIIWDDSLHRSGLASAMVRAYYDTEDDGNYIFKNKWNSVKGVHLGTTSDELEMLNGKPFNFSGFGWDYGGAITNWNDGNLDNQGMGVDLTEGDISKKITEKEYEQILGDQDVTSDHPVVKKLQPKVYRISVYKPT